MTDRQSNTLCCWLLAALFAIVAGLSLFTGCWLKNGIDLEGHVRPAKPNVAPPAPPPPKDDWAPPWFRRPVPKGNHATP